VADIVMLTVNVAVIVRLLTRHVDTTKNDRLICCNFIENVFNMCMPCHIVLITRRTHRPIISLTVESFISNKIMLIVHINANYKKNMNEASENKLNYTIRYDRRV